jgi:phosphatidylglycerol:prolipoprotein diacylglycerol transferase
MHPVLLRLGPISVYSYGAMLMLGFIAAVLWARREAVKQGIEPYKIIDLALWVLIFGLIFARAGFILLNLEYYRSQPFSALFISENRFAIQGLSFHGGLIGAALGGLLFAHRTKLSWLILADISAPALALGYGFGRIGCFLNGCCYGGPADLPWAVRFLDNSLTGTWTLPSHPTQIYSALGSWAIFGLLILMKPRLAAPGRLFFTYVALYSVMRFLIEFLRRGYSAMLAFDSLTQAQAASILLLALSIFLILRLRPRGRASH